MVLSNKMFVRMLTVHCDQNNSYEITINGFQVRKINEIRNVIFGLRYGKPSSALRPKLGCSPSWVLDDIQRFLGQPCLNKHKFVTYVNSKEKSENNLQIPLFLSSDRRSDNVASESGSCCIVGTRPLFLLLSHFSAFLTIFTLCQ